MQIGSGETVWFVGNCGGGGVHVFVCVCKCVCMCVTVPGRRQGRCPVSSCCCLLSRYWPQLSRPASHGSTSHTDP